MASITLQGLEKVYDNGFRAVDDLSIDITDGEFLVLVGPSGCGKSTALRMIAGLEDISGGDLFIGETRVNDLEPKDRDIAMVFQSYALYPHLSVRENIAFPLKLRKVPKDEIARRVDEAARILELTDNLDRKPGRLSGGQRQRVAMGRAIVRQPQVFLMDEPLSNLDAKLRVQMRAEISRLQHSLKVTTVYVTHDQVEAMTMGDRVAVMSKGVLQQIDTPEELYNNPSNLFVAAFIGSPQMNLAKATFNLTPEGAVLTLGSARLAMTAAAVESRPNLRSYDGKELVIGIRPEHLVESTDDAANLITGEVDIRESLGSETILYVKVDIATVNPTGASADGALTGSFVAKLGPQSKLRPGHLAHLDVAVEHIHLFDAQSTLAIR